MNESDKAMSPPAPKRPRLSNAHAKHKHLEWTVDVAGDVNGDNTGPDGQAASKSLGFHDLLSMESNQIHKVYRMENLLRLVAKGNQEIPQVRSEIKSRKIVSFKICFSPLHDLRLSCHRAISVF